MFPFPSFFRAIGNPVRQNIIKILKEKKELPVNELTKMLGLSQSTVSHHLSILKKAGIVDTREEGTQVFYNVCCHMVNHCCKKMCSFIKK